MSASTGRISRWARRFLLVGAGSLIASQAAALASAPRQVEVVLGLYGFVLTTVFGKGYSLVPSYFDRQLAWPSAPAVQLPLITAGVTCLAIAGWGAGPDGFGTAGALFWTAGVAVFLGTIAATIRDNPTGAETGTGGANADRRPVDRYANAFVPVAFAYLALAAIELSGTALGIRTPLRGSPVRVAHLLGPGFALLLLLSVGYRLLPRFLVAAPDRRLVAVVLPLGAAGPALLAWGYPSGPLFRLGAVAETVAVVGFAASYLLLFVRTDRDRVGFYGPLAGVLAGCLGVGLGAHLAFTGLDADLAAVHLRANVFGLLGLSIVGVTYQFYPPALARWPGTGNRTALGVIGGISAGVVLLAAAPLIAEDLATVGHSLVLLSSLVHSYTLLGVFRYQQYK